MASLLVIIAQLLHIFELGRTDTVGIGLVDYDRVSRGQVRHTYLEWHVSEWT
jgi:hypothetical protein